MRVGLVGCGRMGEKRAAALGAGDTLLACADTDSRRAEALAESRGIEALPTSALLELELDAVIVATPPSALARATIAALESGAHVLVEKPGGISRAEIDAIASAARAADRYVHVGFNHRFHPGLARAAAAVKSGELGPLLSIRGRYGHGGRKGYDREWRFDPAISGGGELVDQGMHLLDLTHWIAGPLPLGGSILRASFWAPRVEDTAVLLLGGGGFQDPFAALHASWAEWKNLFSLEISCRTAKLQVDGLVGSYGSQVLTIYTMSPDMGPPEAEVIRYPAEDSSWSSEWTAFKERARAGEAPELESVEWAWSIVESAYAGRGR